MRLLGRGSLSENRDSQFALLRLVQRHLTRDERVATVTWSGRAATDRVGSRDMPDSRKILLAIGVLTALISAPAPAAEQTGSAPDFSSNDVGWIFGVGDYIAVPGEPSPTRNDPAHPY